MDIADDDDDMPIPSTSSSATASTSAGHNNGGHKQSTIYSEILSEYREKYQIRKFKLIIDVVIFKIFVV